MKLTAIFVGILFALTACNAGTATDVTKVAADVSVVVADMTVAEQQIQMQCQTVTNCTVGPDALVEIQSAIGIVTTDLNALKAGNTSTSVTVVLADVNKALQVLAPYAPAIEALVGTLVATPAPGLHAAKVSTGTQSAIAADYAKLKADAETH